MHSDYFSSLCFQIWLLFRVLWGGFDVEVMGVTSRCLASRDNLIFLYVGTS